MRSAPKPYGGVAGPIDFLRVDTTQAGLLVTGTSSDAGKSLLVTGLCRAYQRRGVRVAPFKSQNMSNHSMVCSDGSEIGRAQYLQARAAGVEPSSVHNPVLLKPGSDRRSHVILRGQPAGVLEAGDYANGRKHLAQVAFAAYEDLADEVDLVVCEGAGSPAEINLRAGDYANLGLARRFGLPALLVGDIDRGGVLASLYGTWALLEEEDRAHLAGYVINKFRGDSGVLAPGLDDVSARTGMPWLGTVPWLENVWIDAEDALSVGQWRAAPADGKDAANALSATNRLSVAVIRLPRTSNATDVDALAAEPGLDVHVTTDRDRCMDADLVVLPGTRATVEDLAWLRATGLADVIVQRSQQGKPVLGICGGYQMLLEQISDEVESGAGTVPGLGVLPGNVTFSPDKVLATPTGTWQGTSVRGYEIHHGVAHPQHGEPFPGGVTLGSVWGTMWHGTLESDAFRRRLLTTIGAASGSSWAPSADAPAFVDRREAMITTLADAVETHLDLDAVADIARRGVQG